MSQGGGFYTSSPYSQGSPGGGSGSGGEVKRNSVRPMTIAQVVKATQAHTDAEWSLNGHEVGQVRIIGHVVNINEQTTNINYILEDGTGKIEARRWREQSNEDDARKWGNLEVNSVISVTGHMKAFSSRKYVNSTSMRLSEDPNETTFHMLEALTITLSIEKGPPAGEKPSGTPSGTTSAYSAQSSGTANDEMAEYKQLPILQQEIIRAILSRPDAEGDGVDISFVTTFVKGVPGASTVAIGQAIESLLDAGHVYTTSDDEHFQVSR
ncbi:hypothetical protein D9757_002042 [Collybiopsis confluens]|uniref:Replication protein A 32 kDa subunit n=1 Tax=Collybiopsis confluens TaxID=2823264 RepID=A0A8H5MET9_9AGAR|nr:hypothetical protein D9757_002042 [Collybiopsis confluens]